MLWADEPLICWVFHVCAGLALACLDCNADIPYFHRKEDNKFVMLLQSCMFVFGRLQVNFLDMLKCVAAPLRCAS